MAKVRLKKGISTPLVDKTLLLPVKVAALHVASLGGPPSLKTLPVNW